MATIAEKDILIEENAHLIATCKKSDEVTKQKCMELRKFLYDTNEKLIDFKGTISVMDRIRELRGY